MVVELKDEKVGCHRGLDPAPKPPTVNTKKKSASLVLFVCEFCFSFVSTFSHEMVASFMLQEKKITLLKHTSNSRPGCFVYVTRGKNHLV